ncbi:hypothetical protein IE3_02300 [Bacillus cereus BAG3X2-1]|nr:hypothetical protein IE3_02300 [Bacillus cereus BAG3X2-1]
MQNPIKRISVGMSDDSNRNLQTEIVINAEV